MSPQPALGRGHPLACGRRLASRQVVARRPLPQLGAHALQPRQLGLDAHPLPAEGDDVLVLALDLALLGLQLLEAGAASDVPVAVQLLAREPVDGVSDAHANVTPAKPVPLTLLMASGIRPNRVEMYWKATTLTVKTPESTRGYARNTTGPT
jgi:hypothetical protein